MADALAGIQTWIDTKQKRHNFYCASTQNYTQETAIFILCVSQFKKDKRKKQATLIKTWFVEGKFPPELTEKGYLSELNVGGALRQEGAAKVDAAIKALGRTFADKVANHGGGVLGFGGALAQKFSMSTGVDPEMFDEFIKHTLPSLRDNPPFNAYDPNKVQQPNGNFAGKVQLLAKGIEPHGFNAENLGFY